MFRIIVLTFLLVSSNICFSDDTKTDYSGIWQNTENSLSFYSIQIKDDQVVIIDLSAIESNKSTLESAFLGDTEDLLLSRVSPTTGMTNELQLIFESSTEASIFIICPVCTVVPINIHKVF